jgi:hypothetical protein
MPLTLSRYRSYVAAGLPLRNYRLEEASGTTVADSSANGVAASLSGSATLGVANASLSGSNGYTLTGGYIDCGDIANWEYTQAWSVEFWLKPADTTNFQMFVARALASGTYRGWSICTSFPRTKLAIQLVSDNAGGKIAAVSQDDILAVGTWVHIVVTYSGSGTVAGITLYVNGQPATTTTSSDNLAGATVLAATNLFIGARAGGGSAASATIDEVAIYERVLTETEVSQRYREIISLTADTEYNVFPAIIYADDSSIHVAYRRATAHLLSKGTIQRKISYDAGATWSTADEIASHATYDVRDPQLTKLSTGTLLLTYFLYNHTPGTFFADGVYLKSSTDNGATWSATSQITTAGNFFTEKMGTSSRIVELTATNWLCAVNGHATGETYDSAAIVQTTDAGATWGSKVTIADGEADSKNYVEPGIVRLSSGTLVCLIRNTTDKTIHKATSTDNGATWGALSSAFAGDSSPRPFLDSAGTIHVLYRSATNTRVCYRSSADSGATWSDEAYWTANTSTYEYAAIDQTPVGSLLAAYSIQRGTDADTWIGWQTRNVGESTELAAALLRANAADAATLEAQKAKLLAPTNIAFGASSVTGTLPVAKVMAANGGDILTTDVRSDTVTGAAAGGALDVAGDNAFRARMGL